MKKFLLPILALICIHVLNAQTIVSTTPQNKKVIIEQMTGTG